MSTESEVMALLEAGNPAVEAADAAWVALSAARHLAIAQERSIAMTKLDQRSSEQAGWRRPLTWLVAAVAAAVVLVGVVVVTQRLTETDEPVVAQVAPTRLDVARAAVDAAYRSDTEALAAQPWLEPSAMADLSWIAAYGAATNQAVDEITCQEVGTLGVSCTISAVDDFSRTIGETARFEDAVLLRFDGAENIVDTTWTTEWIGLDDFSSWVGTNEVDYFAAGQICDLQTNRPVACAEKLLELAGRYVGEQGS